MRNVSTESLWRAGGRGRAPGCHREVPSSSCSSSCSAQANHPPTCRAQSECQVAAAPGGSSRGGRGGLQGQGQVTQPSLLHPQQRLQGRDGRRIHSRRWHSHSPCLPSLVAAPHTQRHIHSSACSTPTGSLPLAPHPLQHQLQAVIAPEER